MLVLFGLPVLQHKVLFKLLPIIRMVPDRNAKFNRQSACFVLYSKVEYSSQNEVN